MPLTKSVGNMYPWVTHTHTHLGGKCPHECSYCYVGKGRYGIIPKYTGELRLIEKELDVNYGAGKIIFVEHMNDAFADGVPEHYINRIIAHCKRYPSNTYVFQSKNPARFIDWGFPEKLMLGTTIETNREISISKAPHPMERFKAMMQLRGYDLKNRHPDCKLFITIEPIMEFDLDIMIKELIKIKPDFINIGADSKKCGLPEPSRKEVKGLLDAIQEAGLNIRIKNNLGRLLE